MRQEETKARLKTMQNKIQTKQHKMKNNRKETEETKLKINNTTQLERNRHTHESLNSNRLITNNT